MNIQTISDIHWNSILEIQAQAYQEIGLEALDVLKSKWKVSPESCIVSLSDQNKVLGYLLSHPWQGASPPKLFEVLPNVKHGEYFYLHDLAVNTQSKGQGIGRALLETLTGIARHRGFRNIRLVAVQGSHSFWSHLGFKAVANTAICPQYGEDAVFMEKSLLA